jgi:hypothetical protein
LLDNKISKLKHFKIEVKFKIEFMYFSGSRGNLSHSAGSAHARDGLSEVVEVGINTGGEEVWISAPATLRLTNGALAGLELAIESIIIVPDFSAWVVEAHLAGRNLYNNVSIVSEALIGLILEQAGEVVSECLVTNTGRAKAVELDRVAELKWSLDIEHGECAKSTSERVAGNKDHGGGVEVNQAL